MLERLRTMVTEELGVASSGLVTLSGGHPSFATIRWRHPLDVAKLTQWLYTDASVCLDRKREVLDRPLRVRGASIYRGVGRGRRNNWRASVGVGGREAVPSAPAHSLTRIRPRAATTGWPGSFAARIQRSICPIAPSALLPWNVIARCRWPRSRRRRSPGRTLAGCGCPD
jgi:hypothetical protein